MIALRVAQCDVHLPSFMFFLATSVLNSEPVGGGQPPPSLSVQHDRDKRNPRLRVSGPSTLNVSTLNRIGSRGATEAAEKSERNSQR
jgi:hypothetical protein